MKALFGLVAIIATFILYAIIRMAIIGLIVWGCGWILELFISDPLSLIGHKLTWFQCGALIGFISMFFSSSSKKD